VDSGTIVQVVVKQEVASLGEVQPLGWASRHVDGGKKGKDDAVEQ
jgi:hypothetical protein